jgi:hypothetical protein
MQARLTQKPVQEVIEAISALNLESVKLRLMDEELSEGWSRDYADSIEVAYKHYLTMLVKHQDDAQDIMLSKDVDEFWHTHILQTEKYTKDCMTVFGAYLHHNPHIGKRTAEDMAKREALAAKTRRLYEQEFGPGDHAARAWSGAVIKAQHAAYSSASVLAQDAAYSSAKIRAGASAYSSASIKPSTAAYSSAAIRSADAAYSSASIAAYGAAYSSAAIRATESAYSSASIKASAAAYSSAAIRFADAAYSSASLQPLHAERTVLNA